MAITADFESANPSSNLGKTFPINKSSTNKSSTNKSSINK